MYSIKSDLKGYFDAQTHIMCVSESIITALRQ